MKLNKLLTLLALGSAYTSTALAVENHAKTSEETIKKEFNLKQIESIEVLNGSGNVTVTSTESGKATITALKDKTSNCEVRIELRGTVLEITTESAATLKTNQCLVHFSITAAPGTDLDLRTGSGDIKASGFSGELTFRSGSGKVNFDGNLSSVDGRTGSGNIFGERLISDDIDLSVGSGDITLTYVSVPAKGDVHVRSGSGNVSVLTPPSSRLRSTLSTGSGNVENQISSDPAAKFSVSLNSGSGNLTLKKISL